MPVYEQTYKHYEGQYRPANIAWVIIAMSGIQRMWRNKGIRSLLSISLAFFLINIARLYLAANVDALNFFGFHGNEVEKIVKIDNEYYKDFLTVQTFFCFLITLFVGSSQIALDRRRKTLILYLSKPLSKMEYLFGKGIIVFFYLLLITVVPTIGLVYLYSMFSDNWRYFFENYALLARILTFSLLIDIPLVMIILALSSLSKSTETTAVMFSMVYFLPKVMVPILKNFASSVTHSVFLREGWEMISLNVLWDKMGVVIFKLEDKGPLHWQWYLLTLILISVVCGFISYHRIKAVEVVK